MTLKDTLSCGQRQVSAPFFRGGHPICGKARTRTRTRARSNGTHAAEEVAHAPRPIPVRSLHPPSNVTSTARHLRRPTQPSDTTSAVLRDHPRQPTRPLHPTRLRLPARPHGTAGPARPPPPPTQPTCSSASGLSIHRPARLHKTSAPPLRGPTGTTGTTGTTSAARSSGPPHRKHGTERKGCSRVVESTRNQNVCTSKPPKRADPDDNIINNTHFHIKIFANVGVFIFSSSKPERLKREQESRERAGREPKREPRESKQDPQDPQDPKERRTEEINARQGSVRRFFHPIKTP